MNVIGSAVTVAAANASNATATATLAAAGAGFKWRVLGWHAGFTGAAVATPVAATITIGSNTITDAVSTNDGPRVNLNPAGVDSEENGAPSIALAAGGAGAIGRVAIYAIKVPLAF